VDRSRPTLLGGFQPGEEGGADLDEYGKVGGAAGWLRVPCVDACGLKVAVSTIT
jgi:hypothetical protein